MLTAVNKRLVISDVGWAVRQGPGFSYTYEEGNCHLTIAITLGSSTTASNGTLIILLESKWQWEEQECGRIDDLEIRRVIIGRIKDAVEFLGYEVDLSSLEMSSGLREHESCVYPIGGEVFRCSIGGKSVRFKIERTNEHSKICQLDLKSLRFWDPPHDGHAIQPSELGTLMDHLATLLRKAGMSLMVVK